MTTEEELEIIRGRDERFAAFDLSLVFRQELTGKTALSRLLDVAAKNAEAAMDEFSVISAADTNSILRLQVIVRTYRLLKDTIATILIRGEQAEESIREQDAGRMDVEVIGDG